MGSCFSKEAKESGNDGADLDRPARLPQEKVVPVQPTTGNDHEQPQVTADTAAQTLTTACEDPNATAAATAPLELVFCRFESGRIVRKKRFLSEPFIAVSHVWGPDADWAKVDGVDEEIIVSPEKALFVQTQLPGLMGDSWFWMDVLCVDQRDADARAAGPSHAFLGKTRYGRRPDDQSSDIDFTDEELDGRGKLRKHIEQSHKGEYMDDGVLSRLWPLQEVILSDTVQFAKCEPVPGDDFKGHSPSRPAPSMDKALTLVGSLGILAQTWDTYALDDDSTMWHRLGTGKWSFFDAYFGLGEATRAHSGKVSPAVPRARDLGLHLVSTRQTSKGRDFILAIMPQYRFYRVPPTARKMEDSDSEDGHDGGVSETLQRRLVLEALLRTIGWIDWNEGSRANAEAMTGQTAIIFRLKDAPWEMSAMLVGMVSCGMPLSAYEWAREHLAVVHVNVFQRSFMALAPQKVMKPDTMFFMRQVDDYAMGRDGAMPRFTLMAMDTDSDIYMNQCMFPPDLALSNG
ncbi:hypothetical protein VdG1_09085 [Verticillium dahliae VDG1]|nr:hypothetical protein VdG1_09085 [Verticillium dahliae VDG1]